MATNNYETNTAIMKSDMDEIISYTEKARKDLETLQTEMAKLNAMWEGRAHIAFCFQMNKDYKKIDELLKYLEKLTNEINGAGVIYEKIERSVEEKINAVKI